MKPGYIVTGIGVVLVLAGAVVAQQYLRAEGRVTRGAGRGMGDAARTPILVELFTSEGCSSCPSADRLLAKLAVSQPIEGAEIIALEEHVDYWDHIGWRDPFSAADFTRRQYDYGKHFHLDSVYTPQAVVDGQREFVGSDEGTAVSAIREAAAQEKARVGLQVTSEDTNQLRLNVSIDKLPKGNGSAQAVLAVAEDDLQVHVKSGENSGRNLVHHGVVRRLVPLGKMQDRAAFTTRVTVPLDRSWRRENLQLVAFVQSESSRRILGVGSVPLTARPKG